MAKQKTENDAAPVPAPEPAPQPAPQPAAKPTTVDVVLRRDMQVGDRQRKAGEKLASVMLEDDVALAYLTRACEDGIAGPA
jgi:hypothetical protein